MASGKAVDNVYHVEIPAVTKKLRELFYCAHYLHSHIAHFYALGGPDFVMGPDSDPAKRNILGVVEKVGLEIGGEVIKHRAYAQNIQSIIGGRSTHLVWSLPGGVSKGITKEDQSKITEMGKSCVEFAKFTMKLFDDVVLKNKAYVDLILGDAYKFPTYYMGTVDKNNKVNFYDGDIRVVDHDGKEFHRFKPAQYLDYISEHVEPFSYLKFPYLKKVGWKGFVFGKDNGLYRTAPLARLNAADGMATPIAQAEYEKYFSTLGGKPVHATLAMHWARLVELIYAAERLMELIADPEITDPNVRVIPTAIPTEGVGVVEAPRGTLIHHYTTDEKGIVTKVNLIVGTTHNHAAISLSIKQAAEKLITSGKVVTEGLLNMVEMAFRAYDPCFSCATHTLPGEMPLTINIYDKYRNLQQTVSRDV
jgi:F420-non-reducing hydrogenase large subunit